ncbi:MAG: four-carbon acid sugar kinase family protein [Anaerolineae bacterium]|nr:four-carbon acid sugar kinase family protein [Anaerolineae bacterium]
MSQPDAHVQVAGTPRVILIADDLTGAADSGVTFVKYGARVVVSWAGAVGIKAVSGPAVDSLDADVVAYSTESRHCAEAEAVRRVAEIVADLSSMGRARDPVWIYKKIDSTLRGHPGPELAAVMAALAGDILASDGTGSGRGARLSAGAPRAQGGAVSRALVAPALPAQGRVTRSGVHYVHDVPLAETVFGSEAGISDVRALIAPAFPEGTVKHLSLATLRQGVDAAALILMGPPPRSPCVVAADAETEEDLGALVELALVTGTRLLCGSAGLAEALAARLAGMGVWAPQPAVAQVQPLGKGVLVVAGSLHPQSLRQIEVLAADGVPVVRPAVAWFEDTAMGSDAVLAELAAALNGGAAVLTTAGLPPLSVPGMQLVSRLAEAVAGLLVAHDLAGLVLTGGDAAIAVGRALGATAIRLRGEVERGVPWGCLVGGGWEGLPVVTKAGGFGNEHTLLSAVEFLGAAGKGQAI